MASVSSGKKVAPERILIMGPEGIGKTTFAADCEGVVLLDVEDGSGNIDVPRFPVPGSLQDVEDAIDQLLREKHDFKALAIDTVDRLESLIHRALCDGSKKDSIEDFGYGKGYQFALERWRKLVARLDDLRTRRGMRIILLGHVVIRTFKNPAGDDFDRYQLRIHDKAGGFLKEWCDVVGFAQFETTTTKKSTPSEKAKGLFTGARILHTQRDAAWDAKNRHGLPAELPFSWSAFQRALADGQTEKPEILVRKIDTAIVELGLSIDEETVERAKVAKCGTDAVRLSKALDYYEGRLRLAAKAKEEASS